MINETIERKFEIPYNFDPAYIDTLLSCNLINDSIAFIYVAPLLEDYKTIIRDDPYNSYELTREEYVKHIEKINKYFNGKMQLLLQRKDIVLPIDKLKWYINLGFTHFCCGNPLQAEIIKTYDPNLTTIGSITLHVTKQDILNKENYREYFDYFVLDFRYGKNLEAIKNMPSEKKYMLLVNSLCHHNCDGDRHWFAKNLDLPVGCPGKYPYENNNFNNSILIRPMDLKYFDPYIDVYKMQDRSWPTWMIIRDLVLYTTDFTIYPGIEYSEFMYDTHYIEEPYAKSIQ